MSPAASAQPRRYTLQPRADLAVFYAADAARYGGDPDGSAASAVGHSMLERVGLQAFIDFYADCPSIGFACDGMPIGGLLLDRSPGRPSVPPTAHIAVLPAHHGRWTALFEPALEWLFVRQPRLFVEIETHNAKAMAFLRRYGWPELAQAGTSGDGPASQGQAVRFLLSEVLWPALRRRIPR